MTQSDAEAWAGSLNIQQGLFNKLRSVMQATNPEHAYHYYPIIDDLELHQHSQMLLARHILQQPDTKKPAATGSLNSTSPVTYPPKRGRSRD